MHKATITVAVDNGILCIHHQPKEGFWWRMFDIFFFHSFFHEFQLQSFGKTCENRSDLRELKFHTKHFFLFSISLWNSRKLELHIQSCSMHLCNGNSAMKHRKCLKTKEKNPNTLWCIIEGNTISNIWSVVLRKTVVFPGNYQ